MRLIDADALIFELEEWKKNPNNDDSAVDLVNHFIGIIRATPSAEPKIVGVKFSPFTIEDTSTPSQTSVRGTQEVKIIEMPSAEPSVDIISRDDVFGCIEDAQDGSVETYNILSQVFNDVLALPSADRPQGEWINNEHDIPVCSECGYFTPYDRAIDDYEYGNYCPNCGARMESK